MAEYGHGEDTVMEEPADVIIDREEIWERKQLAGCSMPTLHQKARIS